MTTLQLSHHLLNSTTLVKNGTREPQREQFKQIQRIKELLLYAYVVGPCTVRPIQFSILSTIIEKSYLVYVKGLLVIFELAI